MALRISAWCCFGTCGAVPNGAEQPLAAGDHHGELSVHLARISGDLPALAFALNVECRGCGCSAAPPGLAVIALAWVFRRRARPRRTTRMSRSEM